MFHVDFDSTGLVLDLAYEVICDGLLLQFKLSLLEHIGFVFAQSILFGLQLGCVYSAKF